MEGTQQQQQQQQQQQAAASATAAAAVAAMGDVSAPRRRPLGLLGGATSVLSNTPNAKLKEMKDKENEKERIFASLLREADVELFGAETGGADDASTPQGGEVEVKEGEHKATRGRTDNVAKEERKPAVVLTEARKAQTTPHPRTEATVQEEDEEEENDEIVSVWQTAMEDRQHLQQQQQHGLAARSALGDTDLQYSIGAPAHMPPPPPGVDIDATTTVADTATVASTMSSSGSAFVRPSIEQPQAHASAAMAPFWRRKAMAVAMRPTVAHAGVVPSLPFVPVVAPMDAFHWEAKRREDAEPNGERDAMLRDRASEPLNKMFASRYGWSNVDDSPLPMDVQETKGEEEGNNDNDDKPTGAQHRYRSPSARLDTMLAASLNTARQHFPGEVTDEWLTNVAAAPERIEEYEAQVQTEHRRIVQSGIAPELPDNPFPFV